jgi:hypothetical protein
VDNVTELNAMLALGVTKAVVPLVLGAVPKVTVTPPDV